MNEFRFRVTTMDANRTSAELVESLVVSAPELTEYLRNKRPEYASLTLTLAPERPVPVDPSVAWLILKWVGAAVASGAFAKLGEDIYDFLKGKIRNGRIDPPKS